jgi:RNA polymerase sigma-70 factor (ECF subfamily)
MRCSADHIRELYLAGQCRWPLVSLSLEAFAERWGELPEPSAGLPVDPADLYLCCGCLAGQPEALQAFQRENADVAEASIRRIHDDDDFVNDTLQELWKRLLLGEQAKLRSYAGRGPLQAWLRVAATRVALDRRRADKRHAEREVKLPETLAASAVSPEAVVLKARFGKAFQEALRKSVERLSEQERNVLRMHAVGRCSIDEIGVAYAVHRATAARWIERARERIYEDVRRELCEGHKLTTSEFRSLATFLGAELQLSLGFGSSSLAVRHDANRGDVA